MALPVGLPLPTVADLLMKFLLLAISITLAQIIPPGGMPVQPSMGVGPGLGQPQAVGPQNQQGINSPDQSQIWTGTGMNPFWSVNLVPFGPEAGDHRVHPGFLTAGQTIDLHMYFPF